MLWNDSFFKTLVMSGFQNWSNSTANIMKGILVVFLKKILTQKQFWLLYVPSWKIMHSNKSHSAPKIKETNKKMPTSGKKAFQTSKDEVPIQQRKLTTVPCI